MTPVFIFSLPRSGSTLLQRMLMSRTEIASVSEPWILLPLVNMLPALDGEIIGPYDHRLAQRAIDDFVQKLPNKEEDYWQAVHDFSTALYADICGNEASHFLDKTPRYYLIIQQIRKIFPEAKFIFLYRNPLAVLASIVETWGFGRFGQFYQNHVDLYTGPELMTEGYREFGEDAILVSYEELVSKPELQLGRILDYLGLDSKKIDDQLHSGAALDGRLGDQTGIKKYNKVVSSDLDKWVETFNSYVRRWYARRYLKKIGDDVLTAMGYDRSELFRLLNKSGRLVRPGFFDAFDLLRVHLYQSVTSDKSRRILRKILIPGNLMWKGTKSNTDE